MSLNPVKQHPLVTLGVIIFFAVTALIVFRLSSAKTDARKGRVITVGTRVITPGTAMPIKPGLDVRLLYTADLFQSARQYFSRVDDYIARDVRG